MCVRNQKEMKKMLEDFVAEWKKNLKKLGERRFHSLEDDARAKNRTAFIRDYARVLYSPSFRRLQGKMQLLGIDNVHFHRNRLTHSLEVAQIARTTAEILELDNTIVCETASLAHDIGNPPFGHYGEKILNELSEDIGGFEGNAQTFRVLHRLEKKYPNFGGLNLTIRTLFAVTKYNNKRDKNNKKFLYDDDYEDLNEKLENFGLNNEISIEAQIMDLADEIAYAAHDLEDALSFRMVDIDEILHEFYISTEYKKAYKDLSDIVNTVRERAMKANRFNTSEEYSTIFRKELTAEIVNKLCNNIIVVEDNNKKRLGFNRYKLLAKGLKKLLFKAILRKKDIQLYEKKGGKIIKKLFEVYTDKTFNKDLKLLPPEFRGRKSDCEMKRSVIDYIAGMMDFYAIEQFVIYFGESELKKLF